MMIRRVRARNRYIRFAGLLAAGVWVVLTTVFGGFGVTAGEDAREISFGAVEVEEDVYVLPILIDEMEGVLSGHLEVAFDGTKVRAVTGRKSDLTNKYMFVSMTHEDRVVMSFAAASSTPGSGRIAEIRFEVVDPDADLTGCFRFLSAQVNEGMIEVILPEVSAVGPEEAGDTPEGYALDQNYPNPFNAETRIRYALPSDGAAELSVYAPDGRRVRTLMRGYRSAGAYEAAWDGRNEVGKKAASGIYLYRLRTARITLVRRMLLLR